METFKKIATLAFVQALAEEALRGTPTAVTCTHRIGYTHLRGTMRTKTSGKSSQKELEVSTG